MGILTFLFSGSLLLYLYLILIPNVLHAQLLSDQIDNNSISTEVVPQGTSLQSTNTSGNLTHTDSGNATIEAEVVPQGTALQTLSESSNDTHPSTSETEDIEASISPQGTGLNASE